MRSQFRAILAFLLLFSALAPAAARAQATTGTIYGTITDESRAVLPGASVQVKNVETGATRSLVSDEAGHYRALNLPPGLYAVTAELQGFTSASRGNLTVEIGRDVVADLTMKVGALAEQVTVEAAATNVEFFNNQRLPDVRLETSYRGNGLGGSQLLRTGTFPGIVSGRLNSGFGDVLGQVFGQNFPTWSLGVTVSYPLGRSFEAASAVRSEVERRQAAQRVASLQLDVAETLRQAARQVRSTAEREEAARAGATLAEQRFDSEQRRYEVGLSTSFLVTQAQRDLVQAQVNLVQATLDYQSSIVNFEALQLAPAPGAAETVAIRGSNVVLLPPPAPSGVFRPSSGTGF